MPALSLQRYLVQDLEKVAVIIVLIWQRRQISLSCFHRCADRLEAWKIDPGKPPVPTVRSTHTPSVAPDRDVGFGG